MSERVTVEWPTLGLLVACHAMWLFALFCLAGLSVWLAVPVAAVAAALHASLTHEVIHGHPFRSARVNAALVALPLTLVVPFGRFRDTHLAHHRDAILTDPYDDPESNYLDPAIWAGLPRWLRSVLELNNTLAGRILIGPMVGQAAFMAEDWRRRLDPAVARAWAWHMPALVAVLVVVAVSPMPVWSYVLAAYLGLGLLKIRTFLEHQAHEQARARTVIVEDRGPLALLFLNNNLHVVHHMHPRVPWYRLPQVYGRNPDRYLSINEGYRYRSYGEVFRAYLWRAKDPVPHPLWRAPGG